MAQERNRPSSTPPTSRRSVLQLAAAALASPMAASGGFLENRRVVRSRRGTQMSRLKAAAIAAYQASLTEFGGRLSNAPADLFARRSSGPFDLDIAVVGSGYGGGIMAARLAQQASKRTRICVIERGREWIPGTFPDSLATGALANRNRLLGRQRGDIARPGGLLDFNASGDLSVLVGSGLGGTSLINANVAIEPDDDLFEQSEWPQALRNASALRPFYDAALVELGVRHGPLDSSPKMIAQRRAAARLAVPDRAFYAANLAVTFDDRHLQQPNSQGMLQAPCVLCGDCMSGCNVGAKNTVQMNYLPLARRHGAEIYTRVECDYVEKLDQGYRLHLIYHRKTSAGTELFRFTRTAKVVILSGGALGSTGILLRSQQRGLPLSPSLGHRFSGNGDAIGFVVGSQEFTNGAGRGAYASAEVPVGLGIQTITRINGNGPLRRRVLIQDGNMPRALANVVGMVMRDVDFDRTMVLFGMGHDGSRGRIVLSETGQPMVSWPGHKESASREYVKTLFQKMAEAHGGKYRMLRLFGTKGITVHPLGGCHLADDPEHGVVNDRGEVFDTSQPTGAGGPAVHEGLLVADGAVLPTSVGVNPYLTISALAERTAAAFAMDPQWRRFFS